MSEAIFDVYMKIFESQRDMFADDGYSQVKHQPK